MENKIAETGREMMREQRRRSSPRVGGGGSVGEEFGQKNKFE